MKGSLTIDALKVNGRGSLADRATRKAGENDLLITRFAQKPEGGGGSFPPPPSGLEPGQIEAAALGAALFALARLECQPQKPGTEQRYRRRLRDAGDRRVEAE